MALYQNGILISGANTLPQMTLAEYQVLPVSERPTYWERTDLNYNNIPASDVTYGSGSVEDALDALAPSTLISIENFSVTTNSVGAFIISSDTSKVCVGIIFPLGSEYTYCQYDERNFILFAMNGSKVINTAITGRAILIPKIR